MTDRHRFIVTEYGQDDLRADLDAIRDEYGINHFAFARLWNMRGEGDIKEWLSGKRHIPFWVRVACGLMLDHPGNIAALRAMAAERIITDTKRPHLGEYPYLNQQEDNDHD